MENNHKSQNTGNSDFWSGLLALAKGAVGVWIIIKDNGNNSFGNNDIVKNKAIAKIPFSISGEIFKTVGEQRTR
ncbi:hypothetical protein [Candidatus Nitrosocosmicus arcticus]|uniref:Uncharacterized protein n=1 Tax=Candidatus Nitrosocosmicus arcticus TaxID=2035267 RepID=A0A557SRW1_9ARCH|nr:hypothetical protein [Candidatus Nitrosocosmicus arcticus]TVP39346.1 hypothetical protein NARC_160059 [Candidatus Nitrosocosmicus arcticus]